MTIFMIFKSLPISSYVKVRLFWLKTTIPPAIDEMVVLANLCIELLHETLDYYAEALNGYDRLMCEMNETFWMFYGRDMEANLR